jgi:hypothetical protein
MPKLAIIAVLAALALSASASAQKPFKNTKPPVMVHVDEAKRVYYRDSSCKSPAELAAMKVMKLSDAKSLGYKARKCAK